MKEIITRESENNNILDIRCEEVNIKTENEIVRKIVLDLKDTIRNTNECVGLAANQIGYDKRIFCINFSGDIRSFVNPVIANAKGLTLSREGCMSCPGKEYIIPRNTEIEVHYQTPLGKIESRKIIGYAATVFQHELNHLDGAMISDIGLEITEEYDKASEEEKMELLKAYMDSLDLKAKELNKEIEEDPDLKQINDAIKFTEGLVKGEVEVETEKFNDEQLKQVKNKKE